MHLIDEIVAVKRAEIEESKRKRTVADLRAMIRDTPKVRSFSSALGSGFGLIAEIKKRSPSVGDMRKENVEQALAIYTASPIVQAISVLTDSRFFGGSLDDLWRAKQDTTKPVLRKDFIFSDYQLYEARAYGADAVLLMARISKTKAMKAELRQLFELANELQLDVLFEAHSEDEIKMFPDSAKICGLNSRKFKTARTGGFWAKISLDWLGLTNRDISTELDVFKLVSKLPRRSIKVAESGISPNHISKIRDSGFNSALIGTSLLKSPNGVAAMLSEFESALAHDQSGVHFGVHSENSHPAMA